MEMLWLVIGVTIGILLAWFFLDLRFRRQLAKQEERLSEESRQVSRTMEQELIAHGETKQRLSEKEAKEVAVAEQIAVLKADLEASREELKTAKSDTEEKIAQLTTLRSWNDELGARLKAAEGERARLETALEDARKEHDAETEDSKSRITSLESRLQEAEAAVARLERERDAAVDDSKAQIAALESRLHEEEAATARLEEERAKLEAALKEAEEKEAVAPPEAELVAPHANSEDPADNLTKIKGVGKVLKKKLNDLGITSFQQIADFTQADIDRVNKVLDFPRRIEREKWVEQARAFVDE